MTITFIGCVRTFSQTEKHFENDEFTNDSFSIVVWFLLYLLV